jgi:hypothetical protein
MAGEGIGWAVGFLSFLGSRRGAEIRRCRRGATGHIWSLMGKDLERAVMHIHDFEPFHHILDTIFARSSREWVYLPKAETWSLNSKCVTLDSDEVPPELEDEPDAGIPHFALKNGLKQVLPVDTMQDIVANALEQRPNATPAEIFEAFEFYYARDAFIQM